MNSVVEKLAAIEREVAAIQPKMAPLTERIADIDHKVAGFAQQLTSIAEESAAVKQDIDLTWKSLARIQTLIGESRIESEQLAVGQEESLHRCETMTAVFGAAFQAMSQFFETAQRLGIADQAKAVFQNLPPESTEAFTLPAMPSQTVTAQTMTTADAQPPSSVILPIVDEVHLTFSEKPAEEPVSEDLEMLPASLPDVAELPAESVEPTEVVATETRANETVAEDNWGVIARDVFQEEASLPESAAVSEERQESLITFPPALSDITLPKPESPASDVSESELPESTIPVSEIVETENVSENVFDDSEWKKEEQDKEESAPWAVPSLPDVASLPEMASAGFPNDEIMETESDEIASDAAPSQEIASQLDVPPLHLSVPVLPVQGESLSDEKMDDQEIEDMLASMMTPVTAGAGN